MEAANPKQLVKQVGLSELICYLFAPFMPSQWRKLWQEQKRAEKRSYKKVMVELLLYYVLLSPAVAMPIYNLLLFFPAKEGNFEPGLLGGVKKEDHTFTSSSGKKLHSWFFRNPGAQRTFFVSHGNGGNLTHRTPLIEMLLGTGASVFIYDYEGYGKSEGAPSVDGAVDSGLAAFSYLNRQLNVPPQSVILYGESLGAGVTCQIAKRNKPAALVLQSGFTSLPSIAAEKIWLFALYPSFAYTVNTLDNEAFVKSKPSDLPVLLIHGTADKTIRAHNSERLYAQAREPKGIVRLQNIGHNDCCSGASYEMLVALNNLACAGRAAERDPAAPAAKTAN